MHEFGRFQNVLSGSTTIIDPQFPRLDSKIFELLFSLSFDDFMAAEIGNPIEHHLAVLQLSLEIGIEENLNRLVVGAIALLHDIAPVEKIRTVDIALEKDQGRKNVLEQKRKQHRILHMREGSAMAHRKLLLVNEYCGRVVFGDEEIDQVCEVIRIHDNPSISLPIPKDSRVATAFREADRLWMLSDLGFSYDIERDVSKSGIRDDIGELAAKRLDHVQQRYREERRLYSSEQGPFQDEELFFRTKAGYRIYQRYLDERKKQYGL